MNSIYSPTRLLLALTCTATLTACVAYAPHSNRSDDPLVATQEETSHIPNFGQVAIQHTQSGRLRLMVPEQRVSFYLDPEVVSARFGTPYSDGQFLLVPVHIQTPSCPHRMAVYFISGPRVESFGYVGDNCAAPITEVSGSHWAVRQKVSASRIHTWTLDGSALQKQVWPTKPPRKSKPTEPTATSEIPADTTPVPRVPNTDASPAMPMQTSYPASSRGGATKAHIDLMD